MVSWDATKVNNFHGPALAIQTTYEQRYLRSAINKIYSRLPSNASAAEFGAGYGRLTPVLEEFFDESLGFEREAGLIKLNNALPATIRIQRIQTLQSVPVKGGQLSFSFTCTVLQHMTDEEVNETLSEMKRVTLGGFILLIENTTKDYINGTYGAGRIFTKGRVVSEYATIMAPWALDFTRPRHIGSINGNIWGSLMMFRDPTIEQAGLRQSGRWEMDELRSLREAKNS